MLKLVPRLAAGAALALSVAGFLPATESDISDATSAILHADTVAPKVAALRQVPSVGAIVIDYRGYSPDSAIGNDLINLGIYADRNAAGVTRLRHALATNPVTRNALAANHLNIGRIVGVQIGSTGSLRVYTN